MQLDRTRIAIRERGTSELLDLGLRVVIAYAPQLLLWTGLLALPLAALNTWLIHWMVAEEYSMGANFRYLFTMGQLVILESPLATLATTLFLGRVMFQQATTAPSIRQDLWRFAPQILWTQLLRGSLIGLLLALLLKPGLDPGIAEFLLPLACGYSLLCRAIRPFINEIILLERNPLRSTDANAMTVQRRSRFLHWSGSGEVFSRFLALGFVVVVLMFSLGFSMWFVAGILTSRWRWGFLMVEVLLPLAMWLVVIYTVVVRFLNYLDLRIRREGWEVELKVRAAASELGGQPV